MIRMPSIAPSPATAAATSSFSWGLDDVHPDVGEIPCGGGQSDHLRRHRRARLEALRRWRIRGGRHGHGLDHRTAGDERRQRLEQLPTAGRERLFRWGQASCAQRMRRSRRRGHGSRPVGCGHPTWHASKTVNAPTDRARLTISATGAIAPVTFEWWLNATSFTRSSSSSESKSIRPASWTRVRDPIPLQRGTGTAGKFLPRGSDWRGCSSSVVTMTSPGPIARSKRLSPNVYDTRLIDSVAFLGEHQLVGVGADEGPRCPHDPAHRRRWTPPSADGRRGAPPRSRVMRKSRSASSTCSGRCEVAPESR